MVYGKEGTLNDMLRGLYDTPRARLLMKVVYSTHGREMER